MMASLFPVLVGESGEPSGRLHGTGVEETNVRTIPD